MDACLFCSRELNSGEITSSSWDCSGVLHEHFDHVDFALVERAHTHARTHTHTLTHTRTLLWIVANSIIAWSNHFQIQWRHLCQVHRRSRKHTHTETQTQTHTHIHTHTHTTFPLENDTLICIFLLSWDRGHLKAFYSSSFIELREKLPSHHAAGTTENWQTETLMAESHEATVPAGL